MTAQRGFALPLLLAGIAVLLIGGGAYAYLHPQKTNQPIAIDSAAQVTTPTPDSETADWGTYTNAKFGVEFKYPAELTSKKEDVYDTQSIDILLSNDSYQLSLGINPPGKGSESFQEYAKKTMSIGDKSLTVSLTQDSYPESFPKNKQAVDLLANISTGSDYLSFRLTCKPALCNQDEMRIIFSKILSTFKFTSSTIQTTDWKTYTSSTYGYSLEYPGSGFEIESENGNAIIYPVPPPIEFGPRLGVQVRTETKSNLSAAVDSSIDKYTSIIDRKDITISGITWIKLTYRDISGGGPEFVYVNYFASVNGYLYTTSYNQTSQEDNDVFEKIIKTIKFTSPTHISDSKTTGWKIYTNYGFQIEYPKNLSLSENSASNELALTIKDASGTAIVNVRTLISSQTLQQYLAAYTTQTVQVSGSKELTIQGAEAIQRKETTTSSGWGNVVTYVKKGDTIAVLTINGREHYTEYDEDNMMLYNQIVSTFKFNP